MLRSFSTSGPGGQTLPEPEDPVEFDDPLAILYTSGTTGFPKGAELSHGSMTMNALGSRELEKLTTDDIHLVVLPLFHSFGQTVLMNLSGRGDKDVAQMMDILR